MNPFTPMQRGLLLRETLMPRCFEALTHPTWNVGPVSSMPITNGSESATKVASIRLQTFRSNRALGF